MRRLIRCPPWTDAAIGFLQWLCAHGSWRLSLHFNLFCTFVFFIGQELFEKFSLWFGNGSRYTCLILHNVLLIDTYFLSSGVGINCRSILWYTFSRTSVQPITTKFSIVFWDIFRTYGPCSQKFMRFMSGSEMTPRTTQGLNSVLHSFIPIQFSVQFSIQFLFLYHITSELASWHLTNRAGVSGNRNIDWH